MQSLSTITWSSDPENTVIGHLRLGECHSQSQKGSCRQRGDPRATYLLYNKKWIAKGKHTIVKNGRSLLRAWDSEWNIMTRNDNRNWNETAGVFVVAFRWLTSMGRELIGSWESAFRSLKDSSSWECLKNP